MTFIASKGVKKIVYREVYERDRFAFELAREFASDGGNDTMHDGLLDAQQGNILARQW